MGTTRFGGVVLSAAGLAFAADFFLDFPGARFRATVDLDSGFLGLASSLVEGTLGCSGAFVTFLGEGLECALADGVETLATRPPRTTWFHPSPSSICSAEGLAC